MSSTKFVTVSTEYGPVKGAQIKSALGRDLYKFQTIPYMKAPLGKLRFRDAQAPEKWIEPFDSTIDRPSYVTFVSFKFQFEGTEDAGIVSVATPYLDRKLPVAVYIHGGAFQYAYGKDDMYGCDYLLQKDIVYVTMNYRVGSIGFLSLKDPKLGIPGNTGLKDQVFALKWIKNNIANFGGDPDNITVIGSSAGSASVHYLMISDQAKGLFHRAIPMSGTSFNKTWSLATENNLAERLATARGWNGEGGEEALLEVLENSSALELVMEGETLITDKEKYFEHILFTFNPVVEPYITENTLIPKDPILMARSAWGNDIDCLIGHTSLEGALMAMHPPEIIFKYFQTSDAFVIPRYLKLDMTKQKALEIGQKLKSFYFGNEVPSVATIDKYFKFMGDAHFVHGIYRAILSRVNSGQKGKTFSYRFDLQTKLNLMRKLFNIKCDGTSHGEDGAYFFFGNVKLLHAIGMKLPELDSIEFELIQKVVSIITSFVISGNPDEPSWEHVEDPLKCFNMVNEKFETIEAPEKREFSCGMKFLPT